MDRAQKKSKSSPQAKPGASNAKAKGEKIWRYEGKDRANGKLVKGEITAATEADAKVRLSRRGIYVSSISRQAARRGKAIKDADITLFARQLATMMKAGLPLLQAFEITAKGHPNASMSKLLMDVRADIEQGASLGSAFAKYPRYFDALFCNLVAAGEAGGVLDSLLDKLATYKEKTQAIKKKVKGALMYPTIVLIVAFCLVVAMMVFVLPAFKDMYESVGGELPAITQFVMSISDFFVEWWWLVFGILLAAIFAIRAALKSSRELQNRRDALMLRLPVFGDIMRKATIARWARTTATLFTAGVPLVEALDSVGGAAGNSVYVKATRKIQSEISNGGTLTNAMSDSGLFPNLLIQMTAIGEESGSLDDMLNKAAEFYEDEVDGAVANLSSLMEPIIMVFLGFIVGGLLVAMYLPLFSIGEALK